MAPLVAKAIVRPISEQRIAFVAKRSRDADGCGHPDVAVALVRSGTVGTIALEECARRAAGAGGDTSFRRIGEAQISGLDQ